ncbi:MAG: ABC transporter permease subunit [Chloroflexi bacterium]|nr:MAG: ABC transporter permease subunit [Chloroflexota bacterium]
MSTITTEKARSPGGSLAFSNTSVFSLILRLVLLMVLNAFGLVISYSLFYDGNIGLGLVFAIITIGADIIILVPGLAPLRWMTPGLMLVTLLVIYPLIYTVLTAFTNYGDGHLFTKDSAIDLIRDRGYVPENASTFDYVPYRAGEDEYALWLTNTATGQVLFAKPGEAPQAVDMASLGVVFPSTGDYTVLEQPGPLIGRIGSGLTEITFDDPIGTVTLTMSTPASVETENRYVFNPTQGGLYDRESGEFLEATILQSPDGQNFGFIITLPDGVEIIARPDAPLFIGSAPVVEGYTPLLDNTPFIERGIEKLEFTAPLDEVFIDTVDLETRYIFDYEQGLTLDQRSGRFSSSNSFDTTVYVNPAGEYAFWLTQSGVNNVDVALLVLPGENIREVDLDDRISLRNLNIDLPRGTTIPDRIGAFERTTPSEDMAGLVMDGVTAGFRVGTVDFNRTFVFDPQQGVTINLTTGATYETTILISEDGERFGLWLDGGVQNGTFLARPDEPLFINGTPSEYEGFQLIYTNAERSQALTFLQQIDFDYFGSGGETIGVIDIDSAGQPYRQRYVFNETEDAFIDISTVEVNLSNQDLSALEETSPLVVEGFTKVVWYDANDKTGIFDPLQLRLVYNQPAQAYADIGAVNLGDPQNTAAVDLTTQSLPSIPGVASAPLYVHYPDQQVFAPQRYIYNATAGVFIDPATSDVDMEELTNMSLEALREVEGIIIFSRHDGTGIYVPQGYVYNEVTNQFYNISGIEADLSAFDFEKVNPESLEQVLELVPYDRFEDQGVYAPQGFVYNAEANAFIDGNSFLQLPEGIDLATVALDDPALLSGDVYVYNEATKLYVPSTYVYNAAHDAFIDMDRLPRGVDVDAETIASSENIFAIEGLERVRLVLPDDLRNSLFLYDDDVRPVYNEVVEAYFYAPNIDLSGIDLERVSPEALEALAELRGTPAIFDNPRLSQLIYEATLKMPDSDPSGTYYLGAARGAPDLSPGYRVNIGLQNFRQLIEDSDLLTPLIDIFVWTVTFALLSVLTTFVVGLFMAIILNDNTIPGRKIIRSLLIIPYAIPGVIGILVWQGMLNQNIGIITTTIAEVFGVRFTWFTDPFQAKLAIIIVNLWLGYPYMMLITSGALQAIPSEVYEAAAVDGAKPWQRFWNITLPLLLITVGPLLIASFTFNFNNYLMIELLTRGDPPIPGTPTPAGYTDILISYTYNLAFGTDRGANYGYASAITIVIFILVALVTMFQYRFTKQWEEVGENV